MIVLDQMRFPCSIGVGSEEGRLKGVIAMRKLLARLTLREPIPYIIVAILAISLSVPLLFKTPLYGKIFMMQDMRSHVDALAGTVDRTEIAADVERERDRRTVSLAQSALAADDDLDFYRYAESFYSEQVSATDAGTLVGAEEITRADLAFARAVVDNGLDHVASVSQDLPLSAYLSYAIAQIPSFMLFVPALIGSGLILYHMRRGTLAAAAPVTSRMKYLSAVGCACLAGIAMLALAFAPSSLAALIRNGFGDPSYPVVIARSDGLRITDAGIVQLELILLALLASVLACALSVSLSSLLDIWFAGPLVTLLLICLPMFPHVIATDSPIAPLLAAVPLESLDPVRLTGFAGCFPTSIPDTVSNAGTSTIELLAWSVAIIGGTYLTTCLTRREGSALSNDSPSISSDGIVFDHAVIGYPGQPIASIRDMRLAPHTIYGLVAPNGSGKTTLLKAVSGEWPRLVARGVVKLDGIPVTTGAAYRSRVFLLPSDESKVYSRLSPRAHLEFIKHAWSSGRDVARTAALFNLEGYLDRPVRRLSSGMRQQAMLAMASISDAEFMLLDEPMNALDPSARELDITLINRWMDEGKGVVISSHLLESLGRITGTIMFLKGGSLSQRHVSDADALKTAYEEMYRHDERRCGDETKR